jgi:glyoxylase-like metal-dependent hydrolase (beta-lactamase superfamily II)
MFDCGIHPAFQGMNCLPFLDNEDLDTIDVALITHFHLDHCAAVPYLIGRTNFKGRLIMTHPTKAIFNTLLRDFIKMSAGSSDEQLYTEADLEAAMARAEVLDFDQTLDINGIKVRGWGVGEVCIASPRHSQALLLGVEDLLWVCSQFWRTAFEAACGFMYKLLQLGQQQWLPEIGQHILNYMHVTAACS